MNYTGGMKLTDKQQEMCITAVQQMVQFWSKEAGALEGVFQQMADEQSDSWQELLDALNEG